MRQAAALLALDTALADAGYDAEHNHRLCREELGMRRSVIALNPRNTGRRWPKTPYRRAMRRRFPRALYHQRWHAESGFSQHKRRLGSALTARSTAAQRRELALRVLTHNLMLLSSPGQGFQQSKGMSEATIAPMAAAEAASERLSAPSALSAPAFPWRPFGYDPRRGVCARAALGPGSAMGPTPVGRRPAPGGDARMDTQRGANTRGLP